MLTISEFISLGAYRFPTIILFAIIGFFVSAFIVWFEGKRDGFDDERIFDLFLLLIIVGTIIFVYTFRPLITVDSSSVLYYIIYFWAVGFRVFLAFLAALIPVYIFSKLWKWSVYRILDIFVLSFCLGSCIPILGFSLIYKRYEFFLVLTILFFLYLMFSYLRIARLNSGVIFSIFLLVICAAGLFLFRNTENLLGYGLLMLVSVANIYFRRKRSMTEGNLPTNLINFLRQKLLSKRKRLKAEQQLLIKQDPFQVEGRDRDNAESIDEAILEDQTKEIHDAQTNAVTNMLLQVRRALGRMRIGAYGKCEVCGKPIDPARLKAYPEATTCMEHA